jgi:hypothetical protein
MPRSLEAATAVTAKEPAKKCMPGADLSMLTPELVFLICSWLDFSTLLACLTSCRAFSRHLAPTSRVWSQNSCYSLKQSWPCNTTHFRQRAVMSVRCLLWRDASEDDDLWRCIQRMPLTSLRLHIDRIPELHSQGLVTTVLTTFAPNLRALTLDLQHMWRETAKAMPFPDTPLLEALHIRGHIATCVQPVLHRHNRHSLLTLTLERCLIPLAEHEATFAGSRISLYLR